MSVAGMTTGDGVLRIVAAARTVVVTGDEGRTTCWATSAEHTSW